MNDTTLAEPTPASVYKYYDAQGTLLYIGYTKRGASRNIEHAKAKEWWPFVARQDVSHFDTCEAALEFERKTIGKYRPPFNKHHNPSHRELRALYLASIVDNGTGETFQDQYASMRHRLPLQRVFDRCWSTRKKIVTLMSAPEHAPFANGIARIKRDAGVYLDGGTRVGVIKDVAHLGNRLVVRCLINYAVDEDTLAGYMASVKVSTLKKPIEASITSVQARTRDEEAAERADSEP